MTAAADVVLSAECAVARKYDDCTRMHDWCRQNRDIPLPQSNGKILLVRRCTCACHWQSKSTP